MRFWIFLLFSFVLNAVDYDAVFVGSSPISLCEALYHSYMGERVLIVEQMAECGGAWKSIHICGISHADMGCHDVTWSDQNLTNFFEQYLGCKIVSFSHPLISHAMMPGNAWFSFGCYELISNILKLISQTSIDLRTNCQLERVSFEDPHLVLHLTGNHKTTAKKIYMTPLSTFAIQNQPVPTHRGKYYHVYLLVQDPTTPKFTSGYFGGAGFSRMMNLTYSSGLYGSGRQLIVLQTCSESDYTQAQVENFIQQLKQKNFLDSSAYLLRFEPYTFEATYGGVNLHQLTPLQRSHFETLNTGSLGGMSSYITKWKQVFRPLAAR